MSTAQQEADRLTVWAIEAKAVQADDIIDGIASDTMTTEETAAHGQARFALRTLARLAGTRHRALRDAAMKEANQ